MRIRTLLTALATVTTAFGGLALAGPAGASPTAT
ncbi:polysaccharide lyase family 7 protein, partial [Streptomyces albiflaviniger]|nr:polysaccharide lyase family 7 protein [Streptomyces albiflaviniger]